LSQAASRATLSSMRFVTLWAGLIFTLSLVAASASSRLLFEENFQSADSLSKRWKDVKFSGHTEYNVVTEGTNRVLKAVAKSSATGIATELNLPAKGQYKLQFRWKIDRTPKGASETDIKKFDHAARVFVAFKAGIGPAKTLNYAWSSSAQVGQAFHHPSSGRSRFIVLESGDAKAGQWVTETRDLVADWKQLFGDATLPELAGLGLITDSDGVGVEITAYYDDIRILRE
jgi:hypothetical protein